MRSELATLGAGCFWGVEEAFRTLPGVISTRVGYSGGTTEQPSYEDVCRHSTGHAEVVEVTFDPAVISYQELLEKFFAIHDPTELNRQGPDIGDQYRSVIFTHSQEQAAAARQVKAEVQRQQTKPVTTQILPASPFWRAEEYHQQYIQKGGAAACQS